MPTDDSTAAVTLADVRADLKDVNARIERMERGLADLKLERDSLVGVERWMVSRATSRNVTHVGAIIKRMTTFYGGGEGTPIDRPMHEWAMDALRSLPEHKPMRTRPLLRLMQKRGYNTGATNEYETVFGGLNRVSKRPGSPIVKIGGAWALREWYPNGVPETAENEEVGA